jgi:hypothetical protein
LWFSFDGRLHEIGEIADPRPLLGDGDRSRQKHAQHGEAEGKSP